MLNNLNTEHLALNTISGWKHKIELEEGIKKMYEWYLGEAK